jgi:hypothetical protein
MKKLVTSVVFVQCVVLMNFLQGMEQRKTRQEKKEIHLANATGEPLHLRIRSGDEIHSPIKVILPTQAKEKKYEIALPVTPQGGHLPARGTKNNETFLFPPNTSLSVHIAKDDAPLRIRAWPSHYYPSMDVNQQKQPITTSDKNAKNSIFGIMKNYDEIKDGDTFFLEKGPGANLIQRQVARQATTPIETSLYEPIDTESRIYADF